MPRVYLVIAAFVFLFSNQALAQILNTQVEAQIDYEQRDQMLYYKAKAINKTSQTQSISAVFSVISQADSLENQASNKLQERFVLEQFQESILFRNKIEVQEEQRVILLFLIYDLNENLIAMNRFVLNDHKSQQDVIQDFSDELEQQALQENSDYVILQLENIVIDQTKTKAGRDFYQLFYSQYMASNLKTNSVVKITEAIAMGTSTIIRVHIDNALVFEFFVKSQYDFIRQMSQAALARVQRFIALENQKEKRLKIF